MRSFDERRGGRFLPLILAAALAACGGGYDAFGDEDLASAPAPLASTNGPASDYPVVVGNPYSVAGTSFTPEDKLNYDEVGYAAIDPKGGTAISGEHHTLPLPSYVEVTSLETGRTILLRLERRGPMTGAELIGLSPGAAQALGAGPGTPVRVRRVNPPEEERAMLRAGQSAPARIDTPMSLVNVLRRKLPEGEAPIAVVSANPPPDSGPTAVALPPPAVAANSPPPLPPLQPMGSGSGSLQPVTANIGAPGQQDFPWITSAAKPQPAYVSPSVPTPSPTRAASTASAGFLVQAGAFSSRQNAANAARAIDGSIDYSGSLYRVRTGPFGSRREAEASLAKVRAAGYSDARIYWSGQGA